MPQTFYLFLEIKESCEKKDLPLAADFEGPVLLVAPAAPAFGADPTLGLTDATGGRATAGFVAVAARPLPVVLAAGPLPVVGREVVVVLGFLVAVVTGGVLSSLSLRRFIGAAEACVASSLLGCRKFPGKLHNHFVIQ